MEILNKTQLITKQNCEVQISEIKDKYLNICHVKCSGKSRKNQWQKSFPSVYGGYAMLMDKYLINLPGKFFLVWQINEHSRGAHYEYETYMLDMQGNVLNQFASGFNSNFLLDDKYIWFLVSGDKPYNITSDRDLNLIKLNINTGKVKQNIKLNYPHLINREYKYIIGTQLKIKHNKGIIQIKFSDESSEISTKRIELIKI